jgi:DnaJ-class molecular chaperone
MVDINLKKICSRCLGTGIDIYVAPSITCHSCDGTGWVQSEKLDVTDIMDALIDILEKCNDIKEKVDEIKEVVDAL